MSTSTNTETEIAADVYLWGLPLVIMHRTWQLHCSRVGQGVLRHRRQLASPQARSVVAPNNDTLFSFGWFDLSYGDLRLDVPAMDRPDRYWSVMLLDAFTHVAYVSRRQYGTDGASVRITYDPGTEHDHTRRADTIRIGTPTVWLLVRMGVDGPDDLAQAQALQERIRVSAPPDHVTQRCEPPTGRPDEVYASAETFYDELRRAIELDPPADWHPRLTAAQQSLLDEGSDAHTLRSGVALGHARVQAIGFGEDRAQNGWGTRTKGAQFGNDVASRAASAQFTLAAHHRAENASYTALHDERGEPLDGERPLELRFAPGEEPPARAFWSLTVYGPDMFLCENPLNRYSIGDRTHGLRRGRDGLILTIGGPAPADTSNWLPAPPGPYNLGLRIYEGREDVVGAEWFPPPLRCA